MHCIYPHTVAKNYCYLYMWNVLYLTHFLEREGDFSVPNASVVVLSCCITLFMGFLLYSLFKWQHWGQSEMSMPNSNLLSHSYVQKSWSADILLSTPTLWHVPAPSSRLELCTVGLGQSPRDPMRHLLSYPILSHHFTFSRCNWAIVRSWYLESPPILF